MTTEKKKYFSDEEVLDLLALFDKLATSDDRIVLDTGLADDEDDVA